MDDKFFREKSKNKHLFEKTLREGSKIAFNTPLEVFLELTTKCNLNCIMCARRYDPRLKKTGKDGARDLNFTLINKILHILPSTLFFHPFGFGEPFLYKRFLDVVRMVKETGAVVQFNTSGTLMDEGMAESLVDLGVDTIAFSIDGGTKETFEEIRRGANFDDVIQSIRTLNHKKRGKKSPFPRIYIQFVAMKRNIHELPTLLGLAGDLGVEHIFVAQLVPPCRDMERERVGPEDLEEYREIMDRVRSQAGEAGIFLDGDLFPENSACETAKRRTGEWARAECGMRNAECGVRSAEEKSETCSPDRFRGRLWPGSGIRNPNSELSTLRTPNSQLRTLTCTQPFSTVYITCRGEVKPCCISDEVVGDLNLNGLDEIWNGDAVTRVREGLLKGSPTKECRRCIESGRVPPEQFHLRGVANIVDSGITRRANKKIRATVIIPTRDPGISIERLLNMIFKQEVRYGFEVLIIDSSSNHDTVDMVRKFPVRVEQVPVEEFNHGLTRNLGARSAKGEYLVFCSQDILPVNIYWMDNLIEALDDDVVIAAYSRVWPYPEAHPLSGIDVKRDLVYGPDPRIQSLACEEFYTNLTPFDRRVACHFSNVSSCIRKTELLEEPFQEVDFGEDIAWAKGVLLKGKKIIYQPHSVVYHSHPPQIRQNFLRHYNDSRAIRDLFEYRARKSVPEVFGAWLKDVARDKDYIAGLRMTQRERRKFLAHSIALRLSQVLGQYMGGR